METTKASAAMRQTPALLPAGLGGTFYLEQQIACAAEPPAFQKLKTRDVEANAVIILHGRAWCPLIRLYGLLQPCFDRTWPLPDIRLFRSNAA